MNKKILLKRIREGEGFFQEFKESLERIDRTLVAFANGEGGVVYLGVNDNGKLIPNYRTTNRLKAQIQSIAHNVEPSVAIRLVDLGHALAILVKEGEDKPYRCADGFFLRIGATNQKLSRNDILDLAVKVNRVRFESLQNNHFHYPGDFSREFLEAFVRSSSLESVLTSLGTEDFLVSLGVGQCQRNRLFLNHAGILFFAKNPQALIPQAKISYARYQGVTKTNVIDRAFFIGPLFSQLEQAYRRLSFDIPVTYRLLGQEGRKDLPYYPLRALEEGITNALIHRDYAEDGAEIMIDYYSDRIEVTNPGSLIGSLKIENLGKMSLRRNPLIAELFYRIGKGEKLGSGISRMRELMQNWKLKAPLFSVQEGFFSVTFIGPKQIVPESKLILLPGRPRQFIEEKNLYQDTFSAATYAERFKVTQRTAQKDLEVLISEKMVKKEGLGKNTRYRFST